MTENTWNLSTSSLDLNETTTFEPNTTPHFLLNETNLGNNTSLIFITSGPYIDLANDSYFDNVLLSSLVYVCILMTIGLPGNILVLYVYGFKWNRTTSRIFIMALAGIDLLNCVSSMSTEVYLLLNFFKFDYPYVCKITRSITSFCNNSTTIVLSAIAVDRFKRICRPLEDLIDIRTSKRIVLGAVVFAIATSWPLFVLYGTHNIQLKKIGNYVLIGKTCEIEERWIKTYYPLILVTFLFTCHFAGDILFIVLYTLVGKAIYRQRKQRKSLKSGKKHVAPEISAASCTMDELDDRQNEMRTRNFSFVIWNRIAQNASRSKLTIARSKSQAAAKSKAIPPAVVRRQMSKSSGSSNPGPLHAGKTTLMLFLVTVVFAVSFIPYCIVVILRSTHREEIQNLSSAGKSIYNLLLRSYFMNSVFNPVVYCFISQQFRNQVVGAFKCRDDHLNRSHSQTRSCQGSR